MLKKRVVRQIEMLEGGVNVISILLLKATKLREGQILTFAIEMD